MGRGRDRQTKCTATARTNYLKFICNTLITQLQSQDPTIWGGATKGCPTSPSLTRPLKEVTSKVTKRTKDTPKCNVLLSGSSKTRMTLPGTPQVARTWGAPSRAAHPALAEQVQAAALRFHIESGAHRGPAGADPSGLNPGSEAAPTSSPRPQSRYSGCYATQSSGTQHRALGVTSCPDQGSSQGAAAPAASAQLRFQGSGPRRTM